VKDFKGFSKKSFDKSGNFSCGIPDRQVFPEANNQLLDKSGIGICITTTASTKEEAIELLRLMNIPFIGV
jgi:large subunit ribosomal protein L5